MSEHLLTVEEFAVATRQHPTTVRRQIQRGAIATIRTGRKHMIPQSLATTPRTATQRKGEGQPFGDSTENVSLENAPSENTPQARAGAILAALHSGDKARRNAAIIRLAKSDEQTVEIVTEAAARAVSEWDGPDDDFADWRALDGEPFHFPEEAPDYLKGLYRADKAEKEDI